MLRISLTLALSSLLGCNTATTEVDNTNNDVINTTENCPDNLCVLSGTITEDLTLTADNAYLLRGGVFIGDDETSTTLTIEPGTTIYGETSTDGMLVIRRHSKIMAEGTAENPIVLTSSKAEGSRQRGDWGGLIVNGNARINACADDGGETFCEAYGEGATGWYGGDDDTDSSGVLKYVRVEFAGTLISPDNELNGIAFQGVGSGTMIDYVQVHMNADDGIEFFGGTAQAKHLLVTGVGDDSLDWTDGWRGKAQFVVLQQYSDASDNGIEADNNGEANDASPRSAPTLSNFTIIGSPDSSSSDVGMLIREGTAAHLHNMLVTGMNDSCLDVDHDETFAQITSGDLTISNSILNCTTSFDSESEDPVNLESWFHDGTGNLIADPALTDPYNQSAPGFTPNAGSPVLGSGVAPADSFFDTVDYIGAMDETTDWTAGWTTSVAN